MTVSTWNSLEKIDGQYSKLITDWPCEYKLADGKEVKWVENRLKKKKKINEYLERNFHESLFKY